MTTETLYGITIDVLENQRRTTKSAMALIRGGSARAYDRLDAAWAFGLDKGLPTQAEPIKARLTTIEKKASSAAARGIDAATRYVDEGIDKAFDLAAQGIQSEWAHKVYDTSLYGALSSASLPVAKLSRKLSGNVAATVEKLAHRVAPVAPVVSRPKVATSSVKRAAVKGVAAKRAGVKASAAKTRRRATAA